LISASRKPVGTVLRFLIERPPLNLPVFVQVIEHETQESCGIREPMQHASDHDNDQSAVELRVAGSEKRM